MDALNETVDHVKEELMPDFDFSQFDEQQEAVANGNSGIDTELSWD